MCLDSCLHLRLVNVHYQLLDYLLTTGSDAFDKHKSSITPQARHENFLEKVKHEKKKK